MRSVQVSCPILPGFHHSSWQSHVASAGLAVLIGAGSPLNSCRPRIVSFADSPARCFKSLTRFLYPKTKAPIIKRSRRPPTLHPVAMPMIAPLESPCPERWEDLAVDEDPIAVPPVLEDAGRNTEVVEESDEEAELVVLDELLGERVEVVSPEVAVEDELSILAIAVLEVVFTNASREQTFSVIG
jgi:nitrogen regulatory protein PII-like uncharacterized protein